MQTRQKRTIIFLEIVAQDFSYSLRLLAKNWKLAAIATLSLAAAMTLSVLALSVANGVLLRPPFAKSPQELLTVYTSMPAAEFDGVSYPDYKYYRDHNRSFSGLAAFPNSDFENSLRTTSSRKKWAPPSKSLIIISKSWEFSRSSAACFRRARRAARG